jgi:hypothetical protein
MRTQKGNLALHWAVGVEAQLYAVGLIWAWTVETAKARSRRKKNSLMVSIKGTSYKKLDTPLLL